jgi:hypothetical protein
MKETIIHKMLAPATSSILVLSIAMPRQSEAITLYSMLFNSGVQSLVSINAESGNVTTIGEFANPFGTGDYDFASFDGRLFVSGRNGSNSSTTRTYIHEVSPIDASILSAEQVSINGIMPFFRKAYSVLTVNLESHLATGLASQLGWDHLVLMEPSLTRQAI